MSPEPALTGHCLCGEVRFEVETPLVGSRWCHCTRCQRRTGSLASPAGLAEPGAVRITAGEDLLRGWDPGDGGWVKEFCATCGSHLFARLPDDPSVRSVRLGVIDGDPGVRPEAHQYTAYAAVWTDIPDDGLPRYPEQAPF